MLRLINLAFILCLTAPIVSAQDQQDTKYFYTRQECYPLPAFLDTITQYGEDALFSSSGLTFDTDGTPYPGGVMFFVNQDTGTWTLGTLYPDGTVCITGVGTNFEPYVD